MNAQSKIQAKAQKQPAVAAVPMGLLQRKCACGNHTIAGAECEECAKKKRLGLQTKLKVNTPGDVYEQEADRMAEQVMRMRDATVGMPSRIGSECGDRLHREGGS